MDVVDPERAATALEWLDEFVAATGRVPFLSLRHAGDTERSIYNSETLEMLAEYMRRRGSRQRGKQGKALAADTIDSYISAIRTLRAIESHQAVATPSVNTIAPRASKQQRRSQPLGTRALKRGIRATQLRVLSLVFDSSTPQGGIDWAAALLAHNILLRGAELGTVPGSGQQAAFDPSRHLTIGSIEFRAPCADSDWRPWLIVWVVPAKDTHGRHRSCPMAIQRRSASGAFRSDPMCTYDAVVHAITIQTGTRPPPTGCVAPQFTDMPLFTVQGAVWTTNDTRDLARRLAVLLLLDPSQFGGKSFRIGGATDWREVFGSDAERITRQRGRWHTDIAHIYQRPLAGIHLRGSAAVADAGGADLESLCRGWAQPAIG